MFEIVVDKSLRKKGKRPSVDDLEVKQFTLMSFVLDFVKENVEKGYRVHILKK